MRVWYKLVFVSALVQDIQLKYRDYRSILKYRSMHQISENHLHSSTVSKDVDPSAL